MGLFLLQCILKSSSRSSSVGAIASTSTASNFFSSGTNPYAHWVAHNKCTFKVTNSIANDSIVISGDHDSVHKAVAGSMVQNVLWART